MSPQRPDLIDRFYELAGPIAKLTTEIETLAQEGLELAEARKTQETEAILRRCEDLKVERKAARDKWHSFLRGRGMITED